VETVKIDSESVSLSATSLETLLEKLKTAVKETPKWINLVISIELIPTWMELKLGGYIYFHYPFPIHVRIERKLPEEFWYIECFKEGKRHIIESQPYRMEASQ